jgi:transposase
MPKAYSADMRERVIAEVEGGASRREAAEEFEVSASTAIIWVKRRAAARPNRGAEASRLWRSIRIFCWA